MIARPAAAACALLLSAGLAACGQSYSGSCSSAADVAPAVSSLNEDLQKAEAEGKIDRAKVADAMAQLLVAGNDYVSNQDHAAYCAALAKIRKDAGL